MAQPNENIEIPSRGRPKKRCELDDPIYEMHGHGKSQWKYDHSMSTDYDKSQEHNFNDCKNEIQYCNDNESQNHNPDVYNRIYKNVDRVQNEPRSNIAFGNSETNSSLGVINTGNMEYSMYSLNDKNEYIYETDMYFNDSLHQQSHAVNYENRHANSSLGGSVTSSSSRNMFRLPKTEKVQYANNDRTYSNTYNAVNGGKGLLSHDRNKNRLGKKLSMASGSDQQRMFNNYNDNEKYDFTDGRYSIMNQVPSAKNHYPGQAPVQNSYSQPTSYSEQNSSFYDDSSQYSSPRFIPHDSSNPASVRIQNNNLLANPTVNPYMNRKKRKNNQYFYKIAKSQDRVGLVSPAEYSSVEYINQTDSAQKMFIGTLKQSYSKIQTNNSILPLFLNSSSCYDNPTSHEFEKIASSFLQKSNGLDYENVTVQQLKILMKEFGLSHTGKKHELIERVKNTANLIGDKVRGGNCKKMIKTKDEMSKGVIYREKKQQTIKKEEKPSGNTDEDGSLCSEDWLFF